ncbi:nuclear transport factor 2-like isoform X1 [Prosopis cineraria]|uniref:nuclear transport factor 2-like isoform X1 n=2 Tax=Prosopis cineraria TaxID=364024 RepID=UPI002410B22A|nr:nuclear transport factor 2-like isoform X1 [Prosopis cineraria]
MASPYPFPLTAAQVGTYFVGQYYQVLQHQPEFVHQFYSDSSTMLRIDGNNRETATTMPQIHALVMSLRYAGVEIKSAHSLESWSAGVLVMVSGSVQMKEYNQRRKFMQTFFLAPQEKGFFVLNDIFHFVEEDPIPHHQAVLFSQSNLDSKLNAPMSINKPVSSYLLGADIQAREFVPTNEVKENGVVDNYGYSEQRMQHVSDSEHIREDNTAEESNGSLQVTVNVVQDHVPASAEEPAEEPQKHTYASILRVAKGQPTPSMPAQPSYDKHVSSEWDPQTCSQQPTSANTFERPDTDAGAAEEVPAMEDEGEIKSVYVRNLSPAVSASEIEEEFKKFGPIRPDGVVIRSRKDVGVCYAFVEFMDMNGVHNAVKVSTVQIAGRQVYIEERRPNSYIPSRGRRGRGRGGYQSEAPRGRFGSRGFGRGNGQDGGDRDYNKPSRGNGFYRPSSRQERGYSGHQVPRNGQNLAEST